MLYTFSLSIFSMNDLINTYIPQTLSNTSFYFHFHCPNSSPCPQWNKLLKPRFPVLISPRFPLCLQSHLSETDPIYALHSSVIVNESCYCQKRTNCYRLVRENGGEERGRGSNAKSQEERVEWHICVLGCMDYLHNSLCIVAIVPYNGPWK